MKKYNRIVIRSDNTSLTTLVEKMKSLAGEDFCYDLEASERTNEACKNDSICRGTYYVVFKSELESLYKTQVFVSVKDNELSVFNIISSDRRFLELGVKQYNFVLDHFFHHFMAKCLDASFSNCIHIAGEEQQMEDLIGKEAYNALLRWVQTCNKESPISHPMDESMWFAFICELYKTGKTLHPRDFEQWLTEDCKWPSFYNNVIAELSESLEYSLSLLKYYGDNCSQ